MENQTGGNSSIEGWSGICWWFAGHQVRPPFSISTISALCPHECLVETLNLLLDVSLVSINVSFIFAQWDGGLN